MWKMKAHELALTHRVFVGLLALWASLLGAFFQCGLFWPSPTWARAKPCGLGQIDTSSLETLSLETLNLVKFMLSFCFYSYLLVCLC